MFRIAIFVSVLFASCWGASLIPRRPRHDGRIVGGEPTDITNYPYQVSFEFFGSHHCGAAIISELWVVTAGHCVDGIPVSTVTFRAGTNVMEEGGTVHEAAEIIAHPNFDYLSLDCDIAVSKVTTAFTYQPSVQPVSLASADPPAGAMAVVTGWGSTSSGGALSPLLLKVSVPVVSFDACNASYSKYGGITSNMMCAGADEGGKDSCQGDSGGPLVVEKELVGIVSWGAGCGVRGYPGVYASVAVLREFVTSNTDVQ
uniref:Putative Per a 10 isoallergen n=1 Tax=Periplaneta americana TaxID=6978 RepID=A0A2P0XIE9_PERAM|nr:putative Per a 10 isoallergen [Periplaneta americana]